MTVDPGVPIGTALALGAYAVAADIYVEEPPGASRERMKRAVDSLAESLRQTAGDFFLSGTAPELSSLLDGTSHDERRSFLIELALADPFAPYWFEMTKPRDGSRANALRRLAERSLDLDADCIQIITSRWQSVEKAAAKFGNGFPWQRLVVIGIGSAAVAGLAIAAGPFIAAAMPAAAGLNGAAAISAGLAQLGFGSVAAGGLGMTGGLWMLGLAGSAVGAGGAALGQPAVKRLISTPGGAHVIARELCKLVLSAHLAVENGWFGGRIDESDAAIEAITSAVEGELELERSRNDAKAPRVRELESLASTAAYAGTEIAKLLSRMTGTDPSA